MELVNRDWLPWLLAVVYMVLAGALTHMNGQLEQELREAGWRERRLEARLEGCMRADRAPEPRSEPFQPIFGRSLDPHPL